MCIFVEKPPHFVLKLEILAPFAPVRVDALELSYYHPYELPNQSDLDNQQLFVILPKYRPKFLLFAIGRIGLKLCCEFHNSLVNLSKALQFLKSKVFH
ncbi:MAG: hypothetical protein N5P05_004549 (plasmid) [Chroococcopsis gigantea SAG 12.99]|nr:hypothetical protein [Chroococcopsis gigantea SAG 12.99]